MGSRVAGSSPLPQACIRARYPNGDTELIQVCADAASAEVAERELRALREARPNFPEARSLLLTVTQAALPVPLPADIEALPAYIWLLEE